MQKKDLEGATVFGLLENLEFPEEPVKPFEEVVEKPEMSQEDDVPSIRSDGYLQNLISNTIFRVC